MATSERQPSKDRKVIRWRVKWRTGGSGQWNGEQLDRHGNAKRSNALVEAHDHRRPPAVDEIRKRT
ncbi:hypothetical protein QTQ03_08895 [Micromonospora sp. WMMA1363]|uniref:hypothetical protein n=1 Tax=Micromonospora sp. WMMA1363 TaxID=3053985 RepID=UPI00259D12EE|nr:hypothetical protein [Micromonospora sp. WMMA1363]MDM4719689.1 hypothetical protein [Micromonospora sp. WMMA1363]